MARQKSCLSPKILNLCANRHHLFLVILLSGQIELNPGPVNPPTHNSAQFPCGICKDEVTEDDRALLCDKCELWYHTNCLDNDIDYSVYQNMTSFFLDLFWLWFCQF